MQLILHTGVHYTEQDRIAQTLLRNADFLASKQVAMPNPEAYRGLVRDTLNVMHRKPLADDARSVLLDAILKDAQPERLILSDPNFFRTAGTAVQEGVLYPAAAQRMSYMAQVFAPDQLEIYMTIRNPAALLPIFKNVATHPADDKFWGGRDPRDLRWSDLLSDIRSAVPEVPITVWCNEDMPLIYGEVVRDIAGVPADTRMNGAFDLLHTIMSKEGMQRFRAYLSNYGEISDLQRRRVIAAFLDKFALEDEIEEELDMPGWTEELVDELSDLYDADLEVIEQIPGVRVIAP